MNHRQLHYSNVLLIGLVILLVAILFIILVYPHLNKTESLSVSKLQNINSDGSFVLSKDGVSKDFVLNNSRKFEWYTDPYCGDCIRTHKNTHEVNLKEISAGYLEIKFHPLNYLSHRQSNEYSAILSAYIIGIAELEPTKVFDFMNAIYDKDFRNALKEQSRDTVHEAVKTKARELQVSSVDLIAQNFEFFEAIINKASVNIRNYEKWKELSPKENQSFFVPFIYNVKGGKALLGEEEDTNKFVTEYLKGTVECECE